MFNKMKVHFFIILCIIASIAFANTNTQTASNSHYKHFIIYGQSLSTGHQAYPIISTENISGNFMIGDQIWINYGNTNFTRFTPLVGTISNTFKSQSNIRNRAAGTIAECPLFGAVNHIQLKQPGDLILATSSGTSGMSIEQLSKESQTKTLYNDFLKTIRTAATITKAAGNTIACNAIFWMQGEWNYVGNGEGLTLGSLPTPDKATYKQLMLNLKNNMQADIKTEYGQAEITPFICYQTGVSYIRGKEQNIGMAQLEASNENDDIICAGSVAQMTDRGGHLDPNGYRWYGEMLGKVYYQTVVLKQKFKPLQPYKISRTENSTQLKIEFLIPVKPLVMDSLIMPKVKNYGFEVYAANILQTIKSVRIIDDCVYLTCASPLAGTIEIIYGGINTQGNGNLRDCDPYPSFFKYIDLDKKESNGSYIFARDATETTLRPSYEPKDSKGNVIYDLPYPLFNFSVSFYYKLDADKESYTIPNVLTSLNNINLKATKETDYKITRSNEYLTLRNLTQSVNSLQLFSISGNLIKHFENNVNEISVKEIPKGIYFLQIQFAHKTFCEKLIIN